MRFGNDFSPTLGPSGSLRGAFSRFLRPPRAGGWGADSQRIPAPRIRIPHPSELASVVDPRGTVKAAASRMVGQSPINAFTESSPKVLTEQEEVEVIWAFFGDRTRRSESMRVLL